MWLENSIWKIKIIFILLLDEPDVYLHPNWQKKTIVIFY